MKFPFFNSHFFLFFCRPRLDQPTNCWHIMLGINYAICFTELLGRSNSAFNAFNCAFNCSYFFLCRSAQRPGMSCALGRRLQLQELQVGAGGNRGPSSAAPRHLLPEAVEATQAADDGARKRRRYF